VSRRHAASSFAAPPLFARSHAGTRLAAVGAQQQQRRHDSEHEQADRDPEGVGERPPGESVLAAFRRVVLEGTPRLATTQAVENIETAARVVGASRSLQAREREIVARYTDRLAALIGEEAGLRHGDVEAAAVAAALMGTQRALVAHVHASVLEGRRGRRLATEARAQAERAFARLEHGLSDPYGRAQALESLTAADAVVDRAPEPSIAIEVSQG